MGNMERMLKSVCLAVCVMLSSFPMMASANDDVSDAFLSGYLSRFVDKELGWERGSYQLTVQDGVATIVLPEQDLQRRAELETRVPDIDGLQGINILLQAAEPPTEELPSTLQEIYSFLGVRPDTIPFPVGGLFPPLLADPKQPQFFASYRRYETPVDTVNIGAVGFGETFGFYRRAGKRPGDGIQLSIAGGLFAQFNMDTPSSDLVNADYVIGFPLTYRRGSLAARLRLYHQSSHLGDEFLLNVQPERVNLSFESWELLLSYEWTKWRGYFGGEYLIDRDPSDLKKGALHSGLEYRATKPLLYGGRLVSGLDLKSWQQHDWSVDASLKVGLEFGAARPGHRRLRIMAEVYDGHAPHGQFYDATISYAGLGAYFGF